MAQAGGAGSYAIPSVVGITGPTGTPAVQRMVSATAPVPAALAGAPSPYIHHGPRGSVVVPNQGALMQTAGTAAVAHPSFLPQLDAQVFTQRQPLTAGLADPATLEMQKASYLHALDEQRKGFTESLEEQRRTQLDVIRREAEEQRSKFLAQLEREVKQKEMALEKEFADKVLQLNQQYYSEKGKLEQQALVLANEYQQKSLQEQAVQRQMQLQRERQAMEQHFAAQTAAVNAAAAPSGVPVLAPNAACGACGVAAAAVDGGLARRPSYVPPAMPTWSGSYVPPPVLPPLGAAANDTSCAAATAPFIGTGAGAAPMPQASGSYVPPPAAMEASPGHGSYVPPPASTAYGNAAAPSIGSYVPPPTAMPTTQPQMQTNSYVPPPTAYEVPPPMSMEQRPSYQPPLLTSSMPQSSGSSYVPPPAAAMGDYGSVAEGGRPGMVVQPMLPNYHQSHEKDPRNNFAASTADFASTPHGGLRHYDVPPPNCGGA
eukprot:TRINITY_DN20464_c0_g1_i1.p1 TRINITY_DN20464_c0_g1~~TRINITY_DN20464_c0_g1_i1.p1  ORF type:complete len:524 (+),score=98.94 TRINITY_DN20464_c0_g1_i1:113-1573(+)